MDDWGQGLNVDYLPKGGNPDSFATMSEEQLKKMKNRYGTKRAQDNYNSNKKQYETFAKKCGKQFAKIAYKLWKKTRK